MSVLTILHYPDSRLFKKASPIVTIDESIQKLISNMIETMYQASGIGLAATQVNVHKRLVVININNDRNHDELVLINPEITWMSKEKKISQEGCLSIPGVYANIERSTKIHCTALDRTGDLYEFNAQGLLSICIQHEIDHLEGRVFLNHLSRLKQDRILRKIKKQEVYSQ